MTTVLDVTNLLCPLPVLRTKKAMKTIGMGEVLEVHATDPGSVKDMPVFCQQTGNELVDWRQDGEIYIFRIKRLV